MPMASIGNFAKLSNKSIKETLRLYYKAKEIAKQEGQEENYAYITGILKKMLSLRNESFIKFSDFVNMENT